MVNNKTSQNSIVNITALEKITKHSSYQILHPKILSRFSLNNYKPIGRLELERSNFIRSNSSLEHSRILDIGANTGYFTFDALESGARSVTVYEGNKEHADFLQMCINELGNEKTVSVHNCYFNFDSKDPTPYDYAYCLNVLHHFGDDFGDSHVNLLQAKAEMIHALSNLAKTAKYCWLQLGFNWKGNRSLPLFQHGNKSEIITFIERSCLADWEVQICSAYDPDTGSFKIIDERLLQRFDKLGEFFNRPLLLLKSKHV